MKKIRVFLAIGALLLAFGAALASNLVSSNGYVYWTATSSCELVSTSQTCDLTKTIPCTVIDDESDFFTQPIRVSSDYSIQCGAQLLHD
jgi:hypothetical protein